MAFRAKLFLSELPLRHKQSFVTVALLAIITIAAIVSTSATLKSNTQYSPHDGRAAVLHKLGDLALAIIDEAEAGMFFLTNTSNSSAYDHFADMQAAVDASYTASFDSISSLTEPSSWSYEGEFNFTENSFTRQGLTTLVFVRSRIGKGIQAYNSYYLYVRYLDVLELILALIITIANDYEIRLNADSFMVANSLVNSMYTFFEALRHMALYRKYINMAGKTAEAEAELKSTILALLTQETVVEHMLRPLLTQKSNLVFDVVSASYNLDSQTQLYVNKVVNDETFPVNIPIVQPDLLGPVKIMLRNLQDKVTSSELSRLAQTYTIILIIMTFFIVFFFVISVVEVVFYRVYDARRSAVRLSNDRTMHDVLVRVAEYVREIAVFSLSPPPPLQSMSEQKVSILELQLKYLVGFLQAVAPSLPALLLPEQFQILAAEYSDIKDPATMVLTQPLRDNLRRSKLTLLESGSFNPFLVSMHRRTDLQEELNDVAFVYVSLIAFHSIGTHDKKQFAHEHFKDVLSLIEECVYQYNGVIYSVAFDKVVAVWNAATQYPDFCAQAVSCGLELSDRLYLLREKELVIRNNFSVNIGVVGGTVNVGIFGNDEKKTYSLFGPPVLRGMFVTQTNIFHGTSVTCDEYICKAVQKTHVCKPIELNAEVGCVFQIISEVDNNHPELSVKLDAYNQAFDLYANRCHKSALKAFRAYTKMYGYDSSVERIHTLILGGSDAPI